MELRQEREQLLGCEECGVFGDKNREQIDEGWIQRELKRTVWMTSAQEVALGLKCWNTFRRDQRLADQAAPGSLGGVPGP